MRHCEECMYLASEGYEYPESYCAVGIQEDDPKFVDDDIGCGCTYNLRTLRKKAKDIEEHEYWSSLGYYDFSLMNDIEYTDKNRKKLKKFIALMEHTIGMDHRNTYQRHGKRYYRPYRNYFSTAPRCDGFGCWETLEKAGLAERVHENENGITFSLTRTGMDYLQSKIGVVIYDEED